MNEFAGEVVLVGVWVAALRRMEGWGGKPDRFAAGSQVQYNGLSDGAKEI